MKTSRVAVIALIAFGCLTSCSKSEDSAADVSFTSSTAQAAPAPAAAAPATNVASAPAGRALLARGASGEVVSIALSAGPRVEIAAGGTTTTLTGDSKDSGKRKYYDSSGAQLVEVKPSDNGFKVRTPDGKLLWKVRISHDKIKVSDNEENQNAWSLKTGYPDKAKVLDPSEREIGEVRFAEGATPARVRTATGTDAFTIEGGGGSGAWGVLLMESVPPSHRAVIIAELLALRR